MSDDLVKRLRDMAQAKNDDLSIGDEAAARIAELEAELAQIKANWEEYLAAIAEEEADQRAIKAWQEAAMKRKQEGSHE